MIQKIWMFIPGMNPEMYEYSNTNVLLGYDPGLISSNDPQFQFLTINTSSLWKEFWHNKEASEEKLDITEEGLSLKKEYDNGL